MSPPPALSARYTQEAGVRTLERQIAAVCRHVALAAATAASSAASSDVFAPAAAEAAVVLVTRAMLPQILGPCLFAPPSLHIGGFGVGGEGPATGGDDDDDDDDHDDFVVVVDDNDDDDLLGRPRHSPRPHRARPRPLLPVPGVALGLAWTPFGGELLTIETARMPGSGRVVLTGRLGETMQESAQIALAWIRSHTALLGLDGPRGNHNKSNNNHDGDDNDDRDDENDHDDSGGDSSSGAQGDATRQKQQRRRQRQRQRGQQQRPRGSIMDGTDVHVHFPAGAIPKDGPSAGVAMTAALVSLFLGVPLPADVAMTGEISLSGAVLPVGGVKEKVLAAYVLLLLVLVFFLSFFCHDMLGMHACCRLVWHPKIYRGTAAPEEVVRSRAILKCTEGRPLRRIITCATLAGTRRGAGASSCRTATPATSRRCPRTRRLACAC